MSFHIETRLSADTQSDIEEKGEDISVIEGDISILIGSTYFAQTEEGDQWVVDVLLDELMMALVQAAYRLQKPGESTLLEPSGLIARLRLTRDGAIVRMTQEIQAPPHQEIPPFFPIDDVAIPYKEFCQEVKDAIRRFITNIGDANPSALDSFHIKDISGEASALHCDLKD